MNLHVLDTGTALAWYLPEDFSEVARGWQRQMMDGRVRFAVPSLHFWEFGNVLRTYVRRRELDRTTAGEIYALHVEAPLEIREPDKGTILDVALDFEATVCDAVYISLCLALDVSLLTAERTTTPWVVKLGDRVLPVGR